DPCLWAPGVRLLPAGLVPAHRDEDAAASGAPTGPGRIPRGIGIGHRTPGRARVGDPRALCHRRSHPTPLLLRIARVLLSGSDDSDSGSPGLQRDRLRLTVGYGLLAPYDLHEGPLARPSPRPAGPGLVEARTTAPGPIQGPLRFRADPDPRRA